MSNDPITQSLTEAIDSITESFTQDNSNNVVVDERFFVSVFLPLFAGDEKPLHQSTVEMWMNLAHGPFNEVNVVDAERRFLFAVPALASQDAITPLDGTGKAARMPSVSDMVVQARLYNNRGSNVVQHFIMEELGHRSFMFNAKTMSAEHIRRWNEIFARYNRPLLPVSVADAPTNTPHAHDIARDSSDFEPL